MKMSKNNKSSPNERPIADQEQVQEWIRRYQETGDEAAQTELVLNYNRLVHSLARKYSYGKQYHEDLAQVGMLGLLGAIRRFDPDKGRSFEAFAVPTIIGEIKRFLRDKTWDVHVPRRIKEIGPKIKKAAEELTIELQRSPSIEEIADHIGFSEEEVLESMEMGQSYHSLSMDYRLDADSEGGTVTLMDLVGDQEDGYETMDQRMLVASALEVLSDRERQILQYTYVDQLSQKEAGELLGISQMHVSRLQRRALKKLREAILATDGVE